MSGQRSLLLLLAVVTLCFSVIHGQSVDMTDCGTSKGCFMQPSDCQGSNCDYIATWAKDGDKVNFELAGKTDGWVAIGFSNDTMMGDDSIVECLLTSSGAVLIQTSYSQTQKGDFDILGQEALSDTSGSYENGFVTCTFSRNIVSDNSQVYPLDAPYYLFIGIGPVSGDAKGFHTKFPSITPEKRDVTTYVAETEDDSPPTELAVDTADCGTNKGCFLEPENCEGSNCDYVATWAKDGDKVNFELAGKTDGWVAIGFSNDQTMGDDSVVECLLTSSGAVLVQTSYSKADKGAFDILDQEALSDTSGSYENGFVTCTFARNIVSDNSQVYSLNETYYLLIGVGPVTGDKKGYHPTFPSVTSEQIDVSSDVAGAGAGSATSALLRAHGILMMSAWTLFVCTAIMLARYFKTGWPEKVLCDKKPVWFSMHRILNTLVLLMTVIAFVLIFVDVGGYTANTDQFNTAHPIIGIIVTVLAIVNPLMALARPHPDGENRYIFNWAHWAVGSVASILGVANTYLGLSLNRSGTFVYDWVKYILLAFIVVYVLTVVLLEVEKCFQKRTSDDMEMKAPGEMSAPPAQESMFRYVVFAMYAVFAFGLYLVMLIALAIN